MRNFYQWQNDVFSIVANSYIKSEFANPEKEVKFGEVLKVYYWFMNDALLVGGLK